MVRLVRATSFAALAIVFVDAWLKRFALVHFTSDASLVHPGLFALAVHRNYGIAFNIPLKLPLILLTSIGLGAILLRVVWLHRHTNPLLSAAASLVLIGGLGNVVDRLAYGFTVDYLLFFGRSALNLSDLVILAGIVWMLVASRRETSEEEPLTPSSV